MSDIKMSDVFTDGEVMATEWGDKYVLSDDFHLEIGELHQLSAAAHAINTHDAMQSRINELEKTIADMRAAGNKLAGYVESAGMSISGWTKLAHSPACPECKSRPLNTNHKPYQPTPNQPIYHWAQYFQSEYSVLTTPSFDAQ